MEDYAWLEKLCFMLIAAVLCKGKSDHFYSLKYHFVLKILIENNMYLYCELCLEKNVIAIEFQKISALQKYPCEIIVHSRPVVFGLNVYKIKKIVTWKKSTLYYSNRISSLKSILPRSSAVFYSDWLTDVTSLSCCMTLGKIGLNVWKDISGSDSD